ncbi:MAG: DVU0772 family protein [Desulfovibrionaceae bacterium]
MGQLTQFNNLDIDWDMTPEMAVTLYLEWGNNCWTTPHPPVRSKDDYSNYFVVYAWEGTPKVMLIRRNSECAEELATLELPDPLVRQFKHEFGKLKGVFEPTPEIKDWLKQQMEN